MDGAALSQVICDIYDAAVDPARWPKAMQSSCAFIGGYQALMFWHDAAVQEANAMRKCGAKGQRDLIKLIAGVGRNEP